MASRSRSRSRGRAPRTASTPALGSAAGGGRARRAVRAAASGGGALRRSAAETASEEPARPATVPMAAVNPLLDTERPRRSRSRSRGRAAGRGDRHGDRDDRDGGVRRRRKYTGMSGKEGWGKVRSNLHMITLSRWLVGQKGTSRWMAGLQTANRWFDRFMHPTDAVIRKLEADRRRGHIEDKREIHYERHQLASLLTMASLVSIALVITYITEGASPEFFNYETRFYDPVTLPEVVNFWPIFIWGALLQLVVRLTHTSKKVTISPYRYELAFVSICNCLLAGLLEEIGFRWLFINIAMLIIAAANRIFASLLSHYAAGIVMVVYGVACLLNWDDMPSDRGRKPAAIALVCGCVVLVLAVSGLHPIDSLFAVVHVVMIAVPRRIVRLFSDVPFLFKLSHYDKRYRHAMLLSNVKFVDGHKYQGLWGWINSAAMGIVFMHAMVTYGLLCAIVVHIIYDLSVYAGRWLFLRHDSRII